MAYADRAALLALAAWLAIGCTPAPKIVEAPLLASPATPDRTPSSTDAAPSGVAPPLPDAPFRAGESWTGSYVCRQGPTDLVLRFTEIDGGEVEATFDFHHESSGVKGSFRMKGTYVASSRQVTLTAREWIVQPPGYVTVDLEGQVHGGDAVLVGRVLAEGCGAFRVQKTSM